MPVLNKTALNAIDLVLLYVENPAASAAFYASLFGRPPAEEAPGFAMFVLPGGGKLGLWKRTEVLPAPVAAPGAGELNFILSGKPALEALHEAWAAQGIRILQPPAEMDFGYTFAAADPDGHRLRALVPN